MFGGPADPDRGRARRRRSRRGGWFAPLVAFFVPAFCVVGAAFALAPHKFGYSATHLIAARVIFPRLHVARASSTDVCPEGMALVRDRFCMDRYEASTELVDENGKVIGPHSPYEMVENLRVRAISVPGVHPQGYISRNEAWAACQHANKRLCTDEEWLSACKGPERWEYPYGPRREANRCNDCERAGLWKHGALPHSTFKSFRELNDPLMNQLYGLAKTGTYGACTTPDGIHDLVGNLHEWTADPAGTFRGGYYRNAPEPGPSCSYATDAHNANYHDYSTGFRCCTEPKR